MQPKLYRNLRYFEHFSNQFFGKFKQKFNNFLNCDQKGYNEEEPARTKNITPTILEFPKNMMFVLVNKNVPTWVFVLFLMFASFVPL
jgi:hypothetical protein